MTEQRDDATTDRTTAKFPLATTTDDDGADTYPESLIVVSNRQPYRHEYDESAIPNDTVQPDGIGRTAQVDELGESGVDIGDSITVDEPTGGLTAGLDPVLCRTNGTWIAWGDGDADRVVTDDSDCVAVPPDEGSYTLRRLWLSDEAVESYYYGFSNQVLWPLCHGFVDLVSYQAAYFEWYRRVNSRFAAAVADHAERDSVVWLQDYHLGLAPKMIRNRVPKSVTLAQFWHIPWPTPDTFSNCPHGDQLLEGLLGNDLLSFHIDRYAEQFLECVERFVPNTAVNRADRTIVHEGSTTRVDASPMGVDANAYAEDACEAGTEGWESLCSSYDVPRDNVIGLGVDRLDYTKGIPQRLSALETFFERFPRWRGQFTFVQKATPSRTDIPAYERLGESVRKQVERINERFETESWQPIIYTEDVLPQEQLCALYRHADVMLVSPVNDGMNLVAQEYLAATVDDSGTLLLSERTGAHERLGSHAYTIDPNRIEQFARTIEDALTAPEHERRHRMAVLRRRVFDDNLEAWMHDRFARMKTIHEGPNEPEPSRNEQSSPAS